MRRNGQPVHLTPTEFALLRELAVNRGKLLTHAHLLRRVWGHGYETETEYLRVYVRRLRAKLEADGQRPAHPHPAAGRLPPGPRVNPGSRPNHLPITPELTNANHIRYTKAIARSRYLHGAPPMLRHVNSRRSRVL